MPSYKKILKVARVTIDTLKEIGIEDCCFIGGMACKLYTDGKGRNPRDLDILCLTPDPGGAESIKRQLCREDPDRFFTRRSVNPSNTYKVLYFRTGSNEPGFKKFKIDILVPEILDLPYVPRNYIIKIKKLPCAPLTLLLLHKLKAWDDRLGHLLVKIPKDKRDILDLLRIAKKRRLRVTKSRPYISQSFREDSYERVMKFSKKHPHYISWWIDLGLPNSWFYDL